MSEHNAKVLAAIERANAAVLVIAGGVLFALAIHPPTARIGLQVLAWLLAFGGLALVAEHRVLEAAAAVKPDVDVYLLFTRDGRRLLAHAPETLFDDPALERFRAARRRVQLAAVAALTALVAIGVANAVMTLRAEP
ncbi:MAG: hypothetical protein H6700_00690 [Myxococcales bacterium]|nr:hypothetical protein [Myxococcales bacterium]